MVNGVSQNSDASEQLSGFGLSYHDDALSAEDIPLLTNIYCSQL